VYLALKFGVIVLVTYNLIGNPIISTAGEIMAAASIGEALQYGAFQTIALQTGTGFCTADYDQWPIWSKTLLMCLMFIGGSSGSTAGGIKAIRLWLAIKIVLAELERIFRPSVVRIVRVRTASLDADQKVSILVFIVTFFALFILGAVLIVLMEAAHSGCDLATAMSASMSTLANVGPGVHNVGPTRNYGWFAPESMLVMSVLMALGRLEIFAIIVLFTRRFWRGV
jgi:trk system potassium uptake protein TrkH